MHTGVCETIAGWGLVTDPPAWLLVVLWLSFLYVVFRTVAVGLLRSQMMQAYILARLHAVPMPLHEIVALALEGQDARKIVRCCIMAREARVDISRQSMIEHAQKSGDPEMVIMAMVAAAHARLDLKPETLFEVDLEGSNPLAMVEELSTEKREDGAGDPQPSLDGSRHPDTQQEI